MVNVSGPYNMCTYLILPLLLINEKEINTRGVLVDTYISKDLKYMYINVLDSAAVTEYLNNSNLYRGIIEKNTLNTIHKLIIPSKWIDDLIQFSNGAYSKFSLPAKLMIRKYSGMLYNKADKSGAILTDPMLLGLDKSIVLRRMLEDWLDVDIDEESELLEGITDEVYFSEP